MNIPDSVTCIGQQAFYKCAKLVDVILTSKSSLKELGSGAFQGCEMLKRVALPDNLERVAEQSFMQSGLEELTVPRSAKVIEKRAFCECKQLQNVKFTEGS